jgi:hypothetical protein
VNTQLKALIEFIESSGFINTLSARERQAFWPVYFEALKLIEEGEL